jgi:hypothetical protein
MWTCDVTISEITHAGYEGDLAATSTTPLMQQVSTTFPLFKVEMLGVERTMSQGALCEQTCPITTPWG